jgi:hypothetical protein
MGRSAARKQQGRRCAPGASAFVDLGQTSPIPADQFPAGEIRENAPFRPPLATDMGRSH